MRFAYLCRLIVSRKKPPRLASLVSTVSGGTAPTSATAPNISAIAGGIFEDERFLSRFYMPYLIDSDILNRHSARQTKCMRIRRYAHTEVGNFADICFGTRCRSTGQEGTRRHRCFSIAIRDRAASGFHGQKGLRTPPVPLRLKVEINSREHLTIFGYSKTPFEASSRWFAGSCQMMTYELDELLGKKLRAQHRRSKGRDLFDLALAVKLAHAGPGRIIKAFSDHTSAE